MATECPTFRSLWQQQSRTFRPSTGRNRVANRPRTRLITIVTTTPTQQSAEMDVLTSAAAVQRFGRGVVRHAIASGRWQHPCRGVVVLHNGPLDAAARELVALASAPPGSALGGPSALARDGFEGFEASRPHLVVPRGSRKRSIDGCIVHWSRELSERDVHPLRSPRRTRPSRSVIDLAGWLSSDRHARAAVIAAIQQGLVTTSHDPGVIDEARAMPPSRTDRRVRPRCGRWCPIAARTRL